MDSRDLTTKQADELYQRLRPMFSYLVDLQSRMEQRQFDADDRLYLEVKAARYAMQLLYIGSFAGPRMGAIRGAHYFLPLHCDCQPQRPLAY